MSAEHHWRNMPLRRDTASNAGKARVQRLTLENLVAGPIQLPVERMSLGGGRVFEKRRLCS